MAKITVKTNEKRFPTAMNLYGLFFEDINRSADSGLYPELLRNRSFEDSIVPDDCKLSEDKMFFTTPTGWTCEFAHGEGKQSWIDADNVPPTEIPAWYADGAEMSLDYTDTLNLKRRAALDVKFGEGGRIYNIGFVGLSVEAGKAYNFYMFASAVCCGSVPLTVSVESKDGKVYCEKSFKITKGYNKYETTFVSAGTDHDAIFVIKAEKASQVKFGFSSLMPADTYNGHGLRIDLMEKLAGMKPRFLRFPGGCIVEGFTDESAMRFSKTVGPVWERPTHWNLWNYRTTNGLGYHEYLQICEDLDLEPMYVFNCGMTCQGRHPVMMSEDKIRDMLEEAKNAIEYAVGGVTTKWGSLRAAMGHPAPFKMTYVEIGNENWGPEYNRRYEKCYRELKELYPHIILISNTHTENDGLPTEVADEHFYSTPEFFAENMGRYDTYPRTGPEIFVGEFAVTRNYTAQLRAGVSEAMFMVGMEKNQDIVTLASYAPLFENCHYKSWNPNLIVFNNHRTYGIPSYYAWKLFGNHRGQYVLESSDESDRVFREYKGVPALFADAGAKFKNAVFNGAPVKFAKELLGHVAYDGEAFELTEATEDQKPTGRMAEDPRRLAEYMSHACVIADAEAADTAAFSVEALIEEGKPIKIGIAAFERNDPGMPPEIPVLMRYGCLTWNIENGKSFVTENLFGRGERIAKEIELNLNYGEYNKFSYEATATTGKLYVNDTLVCEYVTPSYPKVASVSQDDGEEIIVKVVNFSDEEQDVEVRLDCDVEGAYKLHYMTGEATDENSFDAPEKVSDKTAECEGAAREFTFAAPKYSVNVLTLRKA